MAATPTTNNHNIITRQENKAREQAHKPQEKIHKDETHKGVPHGEGGTRPMKWGTEKPTEEQGNPWRSGETHGGKICTRRALGTR